MQPRVGVVPPYCRIRALRHAASLLASHAGGLAPASCRHTAASAHSRLRRDSRTRTRNGIVPPHCRISALRRLRGTPAHPPALKPSRPVRGNHHLGPTPILKDEPLPPALCQPKTDSGSAGQPLTSALCTAKPHPVHPPTRKPTRPVRINHHLGPTAILPGQPLPCTLRQPKTDSDPAG